MGYSDIKALFKDAKDLLDGANDIQLKSIVLDIQNCVYELQDENRELRIENHDLKNQKITSSELSFRNGVYLKGGDVYCSVCWDVRNQLVRVVKVGPSQPKENDSNQTVTTMYRCGACGKYRVSDIPFE